MKKLDRFTITIPPSHCCQQRRRNETQFGFLGSPPKEECKVKNMKQQQKMAQAKLGAHRDDKRDAIR